MHATVSHGPTLLFHMTILFVFFYHFSFSVHDLHRTGMKLHKSGSFENDMVIDIETETGSRWIDIMVQVKEPYP